MRARLLYMKPELRKHLKIHLWSIWEVDKITVYTIGRKYPSESKHVDCHHPETKRHIMFYWYEVELID